MAIKYEIIGFVFFILCSITNGQGEEVIIPLAVEGAEVLLEAADAAEATTGAAATIKTSLEKFGEAVLTGLATDALENLVSEKLLLGDKECRATYYYRAGWSMLNEMTAYYTDVSGKTIRDVQSLQGFSILDSGYSSDFSTASLDDSSILKKIEFLSNKGSKTCMKYISIECGAGTGVSGKIRRTQIPMVPLKPALRAGHYTAKDQDDTDYEIKYNCVYIYGDSVSAKSLRGLSVNADIFECGTEAKNKAVMKCIAKNVELFSQNN